MNRYMAVLGLVAALALSLVAAPSDAWDTSPYLMGTGDGFDGSAPTGNGYFLINPTTQPLRVYGAGFHDGYMGPCNYVTIPANGTFYFTTWLSGTMLPDFVMKFFAFPLSGKFDPNAVIGGFQQKFYGDYWNDSCQVTEANLKAVTVNSYTIGEFAMIKEAKCLPYEPPVIDPPWPWPMAGACVLEKQEPHQPS